MPLTPEERSEINRQNAANSTGPKTADGKARSRMNAVTHGLRSEVVAIEGEDPAAVAAREAEWDGYYRPQSPAAKYLTTACVRATLFGDRLERHMGATLGKQVRESGRRNHDAAHDEAVAFIKLMEDDPAAGVAGLRRSAFGCRYLIGRWVHLRRQLTSKVRWSETERDEAIRLQGLDPSPRNLRRCEPAFLTHMHSELCRTNMSERFLRQLFDAKVPDAFREAFTPDSHPDPDSCRQSLLTLIERELAGLDRIFPELAAFEAADLADAPARAAVVTEGPEARLLLRYQSEARNAFLRNYTALEKALAADAARAASRADSPNEPKFHTESAVHEHNASRVVAAAALVVSPNEPKIHTESDGRERNASTPALAESPSEPKMSTESPVHERKASTPCETSPDARESAIVAAAPPLLTFPEARPAAPEPVLLAS